MPIRLKNGSLEGTPLSIETMPYSWNTGLINIVIQWFEVMTILGKRDELIRFFDKGDQRLALLSIFVDGLDSQGATSMDSVISRLTEAIGTVQSATQTLQSFSQVSETHGWLPERIAKVYNVSEYITYDSESGTIKVIDAKKLKTLFTKESPSSEDLQKMVAIFELTVKDDGAIDNSLMEQLIACGYKSKRHYSEGKRLIERISHWSNVYNGAPCTPYPVYRYYHTYDYYTTYTKSNNLDAISEMLSGDEYNDVKAILVNLNPKLEGARLHGEVLVGEDITSYSYDSQGKLTVHGGLPIGDYSEYSKNKGSYIEKKEGTDIFGFEVHIATSQVSNAMGGSSIKQYDITYSTSAKDENRSDYPSYTVYQYADKDGLNSDIIHDICTDMDDSDYRYAVNAIEYFRKDEGMDYSNVGQEAGFWVAGKVAEKFSEALPGVGLVVDILSMATAYDESVAEMEENQKTNAEIKKICANMEARRKNQLLVSETIAEASLRGYHGNYIVKHNSSGLITKIIFTNESIDDSSFSEEYMRFKKYKVDHNESVPNAAAHFDDLSPDLQAQMLCWKMGYSI